MGQQMLAARVHLHEGCTVAVHRHDSEQIAVIVSGRVRWTLGEEGRQQEAGTGEVVHLPSNFPHGVVALEDTIIIDFLSPPGPMGIDNQAH